MHRGRCSIWFDFNNDGHLDLFVKNYADVNVLYANNGDGTFTLVPDAGGLADAAAGQGLGASFRSRITITMALWILRLQATATRSDSIGTWATVISQTSRPRPESSRLPAARESPGVTITMMDCSTSLSPKDAN